MTKIRFELKMDLPEQDADENDDPADLVGNALMKVVGQVRQGTTMGAVYDQNGNRAGFWSFVAGEDDSDEDDDASTDRGLGDPAEGGQ